MKSSNIIFRTAIVLITSFQATVFAKSEFSGYVDMAAKNLYGATASFTVSCSGCHGQSFDILSGGTGFGKDIRAAAVTKGYSPSSITSSQMQTLVAFIETKDSDADGATNKQELSAGTNPGDSASKPVLCQHINPVVSISPATQTGAPGTVLNYSLSIKNADSSACTSSTFNVAANPGSSNLEIQLAMPSVVLSPGQSTTVAVKATSPLLGVPDGNLAFSVGAQNAGATSYQASVSAVYVVLNPPAAVCMRAAPTLTLAPSSQSDFAGATLVYKATLTNKDSMECAGSTFNLTLNSMAPLSGSLSTNSLNLNPGQSMNFDVAMISASNSVPGSNSFNISANDATVAAHTVKASGTYIVKSPMDTSAPSAPANVTVLKAKGGYRVSWDPSNDNIGVTSYNIYVDGGLAAQSTTTSAKVRIRRGLHTVTVKALDASGNESAMSLAVEVVAGK